jgi:hypothetical protein
MQAPIQKPVSAPADRPGVTRSISADIKVPIASDEQRPFSRTMSAQSSTKQSISAISSTSNKPIQTTHDNLPQSKDLGHGFKTASAATRPNSTNLHVLKTEPVGDEDAVDTYFNSQDDAMLLAYNGEGIEEASRPALMSRPPHSNGQNSRPSGSSEIIQSIPVSLKSTHGDLA